MHSQLAGDWGKPLVARGDVARSKIAMVAGNLTVKNCLVGCNLQPAGTSMWGSDCEQLGAATSFYTFPGTITTVLSGDLT